jgi:hypothetical protein
MLVRQIELSKFKSQLAEMGICGSAVIRKRENFLVKIVLHNDCNDYSSAADYRFATPEAPAFFDRGEMVDIV